MKSCDKISFNQQLGKTIVTRHIRSACSDPNKMLHLSSCHEDGWQWWLSSRPVYLAGHDAITNRMNWHLAAARCEQTAQRQERHQFSIRMILDQSSLYSFNINLIRIACYGVPIPTIAQAPLNIWWIDCQEWFGQILHTSAGDYTLADPLTQSAEE